MVSCRRSCRVAYTGIQDQWLPLNPACESQSCDSTIAGSFIDSTVRGGPGTSSFLSKVHQQISERPHAHKALMQGFFLSHSSCTVLQGKNLNTYHYSAIMQTQLSKNTSFLKPSSCAVPVCRCIKSPKNLLVRGLCSGLQPSAMSEDLSQGVNTMVTSAHINSQILTFCAAFRNICGQRDSIAAATELANSKTSGP